MVALPPPHSPCSFGQLSLTRSFSISLSLTLCLFSLLYVCRAVKNPFANFSNKKKMENFVHWIHSFNGQWTICVYVSGCYHFPFSLSLCVTLFCISFYLFPLRYNFVSRVALILTCCGCTTFLSDGHLRVRISFPTIWVADWRSLSDSLGTIFLGSGRRNACGFIILGTHTHISSTYSVPLSIWMTTDQSMCGGEKKLFRIIE